MAAFKSLAIPFAIFTIWVAFCSFQTSAYRIGGWQPIKNLTDPAVVKIGEFAVAEYNKEQKETRSRLSFLGLIKGDRQVVAGLKYRLTISARNSSSNSLETDDYLAVVFEKSWAGELKLTKFRKLIKN